MGADEHLIVDAGRMRLRSTRYGLMLFNRNDQYVGRCLDLLGEFSEDEVATMRQFIRPGMTVLDVGANIGAMTIPLAQAVGPKGKVIAFEPQRQLFFTLCANIAMNSLSHVNPILSAAGENWSRARVPLQNYDRAGDFGHVTLDLDDGDPIDVAPIDAMGLTACNLIKIDVAGWEDNVVKGAAQTIERQRPVLYLGSEQPDQAMKAIATLLEMDYRVYGHFTQPFRTANFYNLAKAPAPLDTMVSRNMLCVHRQSPVTIHGLREVREPPDWVGWAWPDKQKSG